MATTPALLCAALWAGCSTAVAGFVHPGVLVSAQQLNLIRDNVLVKREGPQYVAYQKAIKSRFGKLHYVPFGPPPDGIIVCGSYNHPNIGCSNESIDTATACAYHYSSFYSLFLGPAACA